MKRLDKEIADRGLVDSRSQAENYIKLGMVKVDGVKVSKPGFTVHQGSKISIIGDRYVSRAALKLASISGRMGLDFKGKKVLDIGSSTGGFTDYSLQKGAKRVIAVDVGTDQLHPRLIGNPRIELYEKTDIRDVFLKSSGRSDKTLIESPDIILMDLSFVSLTKILSHVSGICGRNTEIIAMCKPQFEAQKHQINKGVIKNSKMRREILKNFETWLKLNGFIIQEKADSQVAGSKGNVERFYKLRLRG